MKLHCPHCGQKYEIDDSCIGKRAECEMCHNDFKIEQPIDAIAQELEEMRFKNCPYCGERILAVAKKCRHCGEFLEVIGNNSSSSAPRQEPTQQGNFNVAHMVPISSQSRTGGYIVLAIGIFGITLSASGVFGVYSAFPGLVGLVAILISFSILTQKNIKCCRCGYEGRPHLYAGPSGCATVLLLLIGILPGLIYYFACHKRYKCPNCGTEVL